jgi:hypothetical protein
VRVCACAIANAVTIRTKAITIFMRIMYLFT